MKISIKKMFAIIITSALIVPCVFLMAACGNKGSKNQTITSLSAELNTYYVVNSKTLNWENKDLNVTYSDGKTETVKLTKDMIGTYNLVETGKKEVVITYKGKTISKTIYVADYFKKNEILDVVEFAENKSYIFEGCKFNTAISSSAKNINILFDKCEFNAGNTGCGGDKGIYLTSFKNLEVLNSTFGGTTSTGTNSTAGYGVDLNIFNTIAKDVIIKNNKFNITGSSNNAVAISVKTRLGESDRPDDVKGTIGKISGKVLIENNTFTNDNNKIYIGTGPKGSVNPNISTGSFNVIVKNNKTDVNVYERYLLTKEEDSNKDTHKVLVKLNTTKTFGIIAGIDIDSVKTYSNNVLQSGFNFSNGGSVLVTENTIMLDKIVPGDKITFDINIINNSDVIKKYKPSVYSLDGYELYGLLNITFDGEQPTWKKFDAIKGDATIKVVVELPQDVTNNTQTNSTKLVFAIDAIKGNVEVDDNLLTQLKQDFRNSVVVPNENKNDLNIIAGNGAVKFEIPVERIDKTINKIDVNVKPATKAQQSKFKIKDGATAIYYDIKVNGINAETNNIYVYIFIGKGFSNDSDMRPEVYHDKGNGTVEQISKYGVKYDTNSGYLRFRTNTFSSFAIVAYDSRNITLNGKGNPEENGIALASAARKIKAGATITLGKGTYIVPEYFVATVSATFKAAKGAENQVIIKSAIPNQKTFLIGRDATSVILENIKIEGGVGAYGSGQYIYIIPTENGIKYESGSAYALFKNCGDKLILEHDMMLSTSSTGSSTLCSAVNIDRNLTLDLNGYNITLGNSALSYKSTSVLFNVKGDSTFTINGNGGSIDINYLDNGGYVANINSETAKIIVNGGSYYGAPTAFQVTKGTLEVNDGYFDLAKKVKETNPEYSKYIINCIDAAFKDGTAKIIVKGGKFVGTNLTDNEGQNTTYLAFGYKAVKEIQENGEEVYVIKPID